MTIKRSDNFYRLPVGSYYIEELRRKSLWYRIKTWFTRNQIETNRRIEKEIEEEISLKKTMQMLEEAEK